jgi:hypothetical protein
LSTDEVECRRGFKPAGISLVNRPRFVIAIVLGALMLSCSEKSEREEEIEKQRPPEDKIADDCVAFLRATRATAGQGAGNDCPTCPPEGMEVLSFRQMKIDRLSCASDACEVAVTISAVFNPGRGETIGGGLTAWITPEQRAEYLRGDPPKGDQNYRVKVTYKRTGDSWRAIEFDKADGK